jgi:predicted transcriptional regulator
VKQKSLTKVLFESETTMNSLLFLKDGPKTPEQFFAYFNTPEKELLSGLAELQEYYLIIKSDDEVYKLTIVGKLLVDKMTSLLNKLDEIEDTV